KYKDEVMRVLKEKGHEAAMAVLKHNFLTCLYLPTDNSSEMTQEAARFLIDGIAMPNGIHVKGIGGKFYVASVQAMLDEAIVAYTGLNLNKVVAGNLKAILGKSYARLRVSERHAVARDRLMQMIRGYVNASPGKIPPLPQYITRNCIN